MGNRTFSKEKLKPNLFKARKLMPDATFFFPIPLLSLSSRSDWTSLFRIET